MGRSHDYTALVLTAPSLSSQPKQNGTTVLGNLTYEYDRNGNRTKIGGSFARTGIPQGRKLDSVQCRKSADDVRRQNIDIRQQW